MVEVSAEGAGAPLTSDRQRAVPSAALDGALLVHVPTEGPPEALRMAIGLAKPRSTGIIGVGAEAFQPVMFAGMEYMPSSAMQALLDALKRRLDAARDRFFAETKDLTSPVYWYSADEFPDLAMAWHACGADWVVAARPPKDSKPALHPSISGLIMRTGLPVIVPPSAESSLLARRILIGWRDTREASRAISDAMPLLTAANQVVVVTVEGETADELGADRLEEVCRRLEHRGCNVTGERVAKGARSVATALGRAALDHEADLLVVGGYAHSRLREWVMGGVTRDLVEACPVTVLFSH